MNFYQVKDVISKSMKVHKAKKRHKTGVRKIKKSSKMRQSSLTSFFKPRNRPMKTAKRGPMVKQMRQGTLDLMLKRKISKSKRSHTPSRKKKTQPSKTPKHMMKKRRKRKTESIIHVKNKPKVELQHIVPAYTMIHPIKLTKPLPKKKIILHYVKKVEYAPDAGFIKTLQEEMRVFGDDELNDDDEYSLDLPWLKGTPSCRN